jgi:hypothetical protein
VSATHPLLALSGATGRVKLVAYPTAEQVAAETAMGAALPGVGYLDAVDLTLHCHNVRSLAFCGATLCTAADDEVAQWVLPLD